ncbi:MAG: manganese efflux pump family protein [Thermoproteota archaeon]|nr:manganese efflux pump family protein [Thermoproteota archaeon]
MNAYGLRETLLDLTIVLIALSLAMDAFSVSITHGLANKSFKPINALKLGVSFGSFQAFMPILGWLAGVNIIDFISGFDHWIAFGLLSLIGSRMIYESTKDESTKLINSLTISVLLILSIATSIDALAVGLSLSFLNIPILAPAIIIGSITFALSFMGVYFGNRFGHFLGNKVEIVGGIILIGIGLRILLEHL